MTANTPEARIREQDGLIELHIDLCIDNPGKHLGWGFCECDVAQKVRALDRPRSEHAEEFCSDGGCAPNCGAPILPTEPEKADPEVDSPCDVHDGCNGHCRRCGLVVEEGETDHQCPVGFLLPMQPEPKAEKRIGDRTRLEWDQVLKSQGDILSTERKALLDAAFDPAQEKPRK